MISLFWVPSQRYPMGNYKVEGVLHQTNKQNSARARRTKNTYSSKVHPIYGCTLCSFTEPFSGASGGRARRARRALVRVTPCQASKTAFRSRCARPGGTRHVSDQAFCPNIQPRAHARLTGLTRQPHASLPGDPRLCC